MKSLFIVGLVASIFSTSFAQNAVRVEKDDRRAEIREINGLFQRCITENFYSGGIEALGRVGFNVEKSLPSNCGGTFTKVQKGDSKSIVFKNTRCSNVVVGLDTSVGWFTGNVYPEVQYGNTATRMYKLQNPNDHKITIQINKDALGYDNDTYVLLASNSGKSCYYMDIRF